MRVFKLCLFLLIFISSLFSEAVSEKLPPGKEVMSVVDSLKLAIDSNEKNPKDEKVFDAELEAIVRPVFDFEEMAKRSLGAHWKDANKNEQKEFVSLFSDLLAKNYIKKIRENLKNGKVELLDEAIRGEKAALKTQVVSEGEKYSIDYRLMSQASGWKVYDVVIENVGLVTNYRSEFGDIVQKDKVSGLIQKLREKLENREE